MKLSHGPPLQFIVSSLEVFQFSELCGLDLILGRIQKLILEQN